MILFKRIIKSILKYKTLSSLSLLSLIISFTGIIILSLYISFEKSFESFHENKDSIVLLETAMYGSNVPATLADLIENNIPEVEDLAVLSFGGNLISTPKLDAQNINFRSRLVSARNSFFQMFSFPLQIGNPETVLSEPYSVVLTKSLADKLFGDTNPVGESILISGETYKVDGVMKDFPLNSSFKADCIYSHATLLKNNSRGVNSWSEWSFTIFLKLKSGTEATMLAKKIGEIPGIAETLQNFKNRYPDQDFLQLAPLTNIHFKKDSFNFSYTNPVILRVLSLLAIILAIMGIVNFINFSTSQAPLRSKALSILQVMGGKRISSMGQIIIESIIVSLTALVISLIIYWIVFRSIESVFGIEGLFMEGRYQFMLWFVLFAIGFGFIAGIYPSRYITSSPIAQTVKGNAHFKGKGKTIRNSLVVLQFIFTIALISSAFIIEKQLDFWRNFDIGIDKEHVVYLPTSRELQNHHQALADELLKNNAITDYTYSQFAPGMVGMGWGREVDGQYIQFKAWPVDDKFIDFFGIKIDQGRKFANGSKVDLNSFIMNQRAIEEFGWEKPLERRLPGFGFTGQVIGVAENFNFSSLKEEVEPMVFWRTDARKNNLLLRLKPGNYTQILAEIKKTTMQFDPKLQVNIQFLDDQLQQQYAKEEKTAHFIEFVALWCMLLALTSILGLIVFISRDRIKEIGIRKVNGAKISEILTMLNKDFIKWVVIAFIIACPIAYYAMSKWLENFAYKTELSWWIFALAGLLALGIAILTVSWQSWRAATRNPVEALRYE